MLIHLSTGPPCQEGFAFKPLRVGRCKSLVWWIIKCVEGRMCCVGLTLNLPIYRDAAMGGGGGLYVGDLNVHDTIMDLRARVQALMDALKTQKEEAKADLKKQEEDAKVAIAELEKNPSGSWRSVYS